ncbi:MAG: ATP synthase F1 subunit epsilon [Treponema sp.]|jgi:F-type H+-transporting ATPase subunit epsilon|nr:ATP synthase F1 subunit epsilon [Treponema sp.]
MKPFKFEVHTPYRQFFSGEIEALTVTLPDGEMTVYAGHSFCTAPVLPGFLRIRDREGTWKNAFVAEGILEVKGHNTILMADAAEWPGEIDRDRAEKSLAAAEETIASSMLKFEITAATAARRRAYYRLRVLAAEETPA